MALQFDSFTLAAGSILVSVGAAWGGMKMGMSRFMTHEDHRKICHEKSDETNVLIEKLFDRVEQANKDISFIRGKLEGK
jgi:hypothetical protein